MKWLWITGWTYLVFVLHSGFARELAIAGCTPHLILAGLILMTVRSGGRQGILLAGGWGLLSDSLTDGRLGVDVVHLTLAALAVQQVHARWPLSSAWRLGALSVVVVWAEVVASTSVRMLSGGQSPHLPAIVPHAAGPALYTALVVAGMSFAAQIVLRRSTEVIEASAPTVSNKWRMLTE